jgi:hypothetical protein
MVISDGRHRLIHEKSKTTIYGVGGYFGKTVDYANKSSFGGIVSRVSV